MSIYYNEHLREFYLSNDSLSYIFRVLENGELEHLYYGKKLCYQVSFAHMSALHERAYVTYQGKDSKHISYDIMKREYPDYGRGDYSEGAFGVIYEDGSVITEYVFDDFEIQEGKPLIDNGRLPATYMDKKTEGETLTIRMVDRLTECVVYLSYTIYSDRPVLTRSCRFVNEGNTSIRLTKAMSMSVDFEDMYFDLLQLSGAWARENHIEVNALRHGSQSVSSTRGASSHQHNPFVALKRKGCSEDSGEVYGFSLVYSGNFIADVSVNHYDQTRVSMGINDHNFSWLLAKGEQFQSPEVVMVYSDSGLNKMSQTYHKLYRERLIAGNKRSTLPPIVMNNWEATYFDFDETKLDNIAKVAATIGIETFVLDDGWFTNRNNDQSGLGDWSIDYNKLPQGLKGLGEKFDSHGIKLGIWVEPESVSEVSELYEEHPEWVIQTPNRNKSIGRNQYLLDYTNEDVVDYIFDKLSIIVEDAQVTYMKWDMNRNITEPYSVGLAADRQGEFMHRYMLGLYDLLHRLTSTFPDLMIESCAGGGGRFDPGMLYFAPLTWTSDNTDAIDRLQIQKGTSICYPLRSMGSHVSVAPNHQVGRYTKLQTRVDVASFGAYGCQLDITKMSDEELDIIEKSITRYKRIRPYLESGDFYRLETKDQGVTAWMIVSEDQKEAVLGVYQVLAKANPPKDVIKLCGLLTDVIYENASTGQIHGGDELMYRGLTFNNEAHYYVSEKDLLRKKQLGAGDFTSEIHIFKEQD